MKVLIIYPKFYVYGGGEKLVVRLANYLVNSGIENAVLTTAVIDEVCRDLQGTKVLVEENRKGTARGEMVALCRGVRRYARDYNVLNPHNYPAEVAAAFSQKPSIWMCNEPELHLSLKFGSFNWKYRLFLKALAPCERYIVRRRIDRWVVADRFNADRFRALYGREPEIIPYGIDAEYFSVADRGEARRRLGLRSKFVVLHVGMMTKLKNQMASLEALNRLKNKIPGIMLVLAGSWLDDYRRDIDDYIKMNDLRGKVVITGHITREELRDWYCAGDVLLHPILSQGGWLSPFEALCAGMPVIVSRDMTAADIIVDNGFGTVTDDYEGSLLGVYMNPGGHQANARRAAEWVRANLSWDTFGGAMLNVFRSALEGTA